MIKKMLFFLFIISLFQCKKDKESEIIINNQIDSLNNHANKLFENGKIEESLIIYKKVINKSQQVNNNKVLTKAYFSIANCYYELGNAPLGSEYLFLAEENAKDYSESMAYINMLKGFILYNAYSYDEAEKRFKIVINHANGIDNKPKAEMLIDRAYINIGNINFQQEKYDSALFYYKKALKSSDSANKIASNINIAEIFLINNKVDSADKYIQFAENNYKSIPYQTLLIKVKEALNGVKGLYFIKKGENREAIKILRNNSNETTYYTSDELLGMAYSKLGKIDSSAFYFQKNMDKKMSEKKHNLNIYKASNIIHNDEKKAILKIQKQQKITYSWYVGLSILSIIALILMFNYRQKMNKQRTQYLETEKEKMRMEKELSELKQEQYQKQVLATSIQLEQKSIFLDDLKNNIKNNKDFNLNNYLKNKQLIEKDLNNIQEILKEIHPSFFKNLNEIATSKLTNLDIKYAAYIYMNMDNTQIASVLNVDPKTVSVTKYRLKQKLGLTKETDLDSFIRKIN